MNLQRSLPESLAGTLFASSSLFACCMKCEGANTTVDVMECFWRNLQKRTDGREREQHLQSIHRHQSSPVGWATFKKSFVTICWSTFSQCSLLRRYKSSLQSWPFAILSFCRTSWQRGSQMAFCDCGAKLWIELNENNKFAPSPAPSLPKFTIIQSTSSHSLEIIRVICKILKAIFHL